MTWTPPSLDTPKELRTRLSVDEWRHAMLEICQQNDLDETRLHAFSTGSDVVWSAGDIVIKLSEPKWTAAIERESELLSQVEGKLSVATPKPLATGDIQGWPYLLMSKVPGVPLAHIWPDASAPTRKRLATEIGRMTSELHGIDVRAESDTWNSLWARCQLEVAQRHIDR